MGSGEENTPVKPLKPATGTQEVPTTPSYVDWPTPIPHLIPSYGTPIPYPAIYSHGGIYTHPPITLAQGTVAVATETEGKPLDGKDRGTMKKSKGSSGNISVVGAKSEEGGKAVSCSANDGGSQSGGSGSEGSSDASEDSNQNKCRSNYCLTCISMACQICLPPICEFGDFPTTKRRSFDQMLVDGANARQNSAAQYSGRAVDFNSRGQMATNLPVSALGNPAGTVPGTNLNIGMDLWNSSPAGVVSMKARPTAGGATSAMVPAAVAGREGVPSDLWIHDERELKRQKRKQSNRESARRSRLRKQAECEELAAKVETLTHENRTLRNELQRLADECEKLTSENASITEQLNELYGHDPAATGEGNDTNSTVFQAVNGEGNGHFHENSRGSNSVSIQQNSKYLNSNGKLESGKK